MTAGATELPFSILQVLVHSPSLDKKPLENRKYASFTCIFTGLSTLVGSKEEEQKRKEGGREESDK